jgi:hypothetical protein
VKLSFEIPPCFSVEFNVTLLSCVLLRLYSVMPCKEKYGYCYFSELNRDLGKPCITPTLRVAYVCTCMYVCMYVCVCV